MSIGRAGRARLATKGKGANRPLPSLPLATPLRVQLQASTGACWEAVSPAAGVRRNTGKRYQAKGG